MKTKTKTAQGATPATKNHENKLAEWKRAVGVFRPSQTGAKCAFCGKPVEDQCAALAERPLCANCRDAENSRIAKRRVRDFAATAEWSRVEGFVHAAAAIGLSF